MILDRLLHSSSLSSCRLSDCTKTNASDAHQERSNVASEGQSDGELSWIDVSWLFPLSSSLCSEGGDSFTSSSTNSSVQASVYVIIISSHAVKMRSRSTPQVGHCDEAGKADGVLSHLK